MAMRKIPADTATFHFFNANPKGNKSCDCVVRAIAGATGQTWDETLEGMVAMAMKLKLMPNDPKCYGKYIQSLGWHKQKQPKLKDGTKYTGAEFVKRFEGTMIAHIGGHHLVCIKDHQVWDTWDSTRGCIGNIWTNDDIHDPNLLHALNGQGE